MSLPIDTKDTSIFIKILVIVAGILLSSLSGWFLYDEEEKAIISEFHKDVDERAASLYREVAINFETLRSLAILFNGETVPELKQFSREAKKILTRHSDIQALEWIPRILDSEREKYEAKQRQEFPEFEITERKKQGHMVTAGKRKVYFPVYYVEPLIGNEVAFGFDLSSNPIRRKALEKSTDTATPQASASITLVQEHAKQKGFLAFLPIYNGIPSTVNKRRENLKGFILGVYRIGDIFTSSALSDEQHGIEIKLVDETLSSAHSILHTHKLRTGFTSHKNFTYRKELPEIWGRKWSLIASPALSYVAVRRGILPLAIFVTGIIFTFFIVFYIHIITRRAAIIRKIVTEKTNELNKANKKLKKMSRTDGLTGIANRRFMDEFLDKEWLRAIRNQSPLSFILIDIDFLNYITIAMVILKVMNA